MAQLSFKQGEDKIVQLSVLKNNVPVDCSTATDIRVHAKVTTQTNTIEVFRYAKVPVSGYGTCDVNNITNNIVDVTLERTQTRTFPTGAISFYVLIQFPDINFPNGVRHEEFDFPVIGRVNTGNTSLEPIPS